MKLNTNTHEVTGTGFDAVSDFTVEVNSKTFKVLSDTIYKDKIGSIVRELSCNAYDAHTVAGNTDTPFDIHLPDAFEPYFSIRDYGTGISAEDIIGVYTKYFASTKDQSNDEVGAFGLGSKTPFSYTDAFTVISIHKGIKTMYNAHVNKGLPAIVAYGKPEKTSEPDGLEVNVGVNTVDHKDFANAVKRQLKFFPVKPNVTNGSIEWTVQETVLKHEGFTLYKIANAPSWSYHSRNEASGLFVKQGPIGYPVDFEILEQYLSSKDIPKTEFFQYLKQSTNFNNKGVVIDMPIGTVEVTASREAISYSDITIKNIFTKIDSIAKKVFNDVRVQLDVAYKQSPKAFYDAFVSMDQYFTSSIDNDVLNATFPLFTFSGKGTVWYRVPKYIGKDIVFESYEVSGYTKPRRASFNRPRRINESDPNSELVINAAYLFSDDYQVRFLKDVKTRFIGRIEDNCDGKSIVITLPSDITVDNFNKWTKNTISLVAFSSLPAPPINRKGGGGNGGHSITGGQNRVWFDLSNINSANDGFVYGEGTLYSLGFKQEFSESLIDAIDENEQYVYVLTHGNKIVRDSLGIDSLTSQTVEEVSAFIKWLDKTNMVIAIPQNNESIIADLGNVSAFKDAWADRANTFYSELMTQFTQWAESKYYVAAFNEFVASSWHDVFTMQKVISSVSEFIDTSVLEATIPDRILKDFSGEVTYDNNIGTIHRLLKNNGLSNSDVDLLRSENLDVLDTRTYEIVLERLGVNIDKKVSVMMETYKEWLTSNLSKLIVYYTIERRSRDMFSDGSYGLGFRDPMNCEDYVDGAYFLNKSKALLKGA